MPAGGILLSLPLYPGTPIILTSFAPLLSATLTYEPTCKPVAILLLEKAGLPFPFLGITSHQLS
ncbi:hypothetical protein D1872_314480 [compost metagenome]